jgi:signal peptidase I
VPSRHRRASRIEATRSAALDIDPLTGERVPDPYRVRRQPARDGNGNANGNANGNGNGNGNGGYPVRPYVRGQQPAARGVPPHPGQAAGRQDPAPAPSQAAWPWPAGGSPTPWAAGQAGPVGQGYGRQAAPNGYGRGAPGGPAAAGPSDFFQSPQTPPWAAPRPGGTPQHDGQAPSHTGQVPPVAAPWGGFVGGPYQAPAGGAVGNRTNGGAGPEGDPWSVPAGRAGAPRPAVGRGRDPLTGEIVTDPYRVTPSRARRHAGPGRQGAPSRRTGRHDGGRRRPLWAELPVLVVIALILAVGIKSLLVQAFYIPSESMVPTLKVNDRVLVNRLAYRFGEPERGQVVVFVRRDPATAPNPGPLGLVQRAVAQSLGNAPPGSEDLIKRVIAVPGDTVEGKDGRVLVNGEPVGEPYLAPDTVTSSFGPVKIRPGHVFVMGDNREGSLDSRRFGQVPEADLVGRAVVLLWPFDSVGGL